MMNEQSLLSRLDAGKKSNQYTVVADPTRLIDNICRNLQDMLNVRIGSVLALDEFGMPDFNDVVKEFPDAITRIRNAIQHFISCFEPRLRQVRVKHIHDPEQPLLLKFAICAEVKAAIVTDPISFTTVLTGAGQATVKV